MVVSGRSHFSKGLKMKIASIIVAVIAVVVGAFYFSQPNRPACDDNILASNTGCDFDLRGNGK